ncbi:hypothetical protein [Nocardia flavorosea]|uniref:Uncharacterized protein n=1 Tax=Nocardia flavorosea TaxID=53429 RepID=A0A846YT46_9NOCA|nr:hypothetical protein [Nocardia flavorosea]NKY60452.1 hypothetical protein [Nocardia flavorosea]
MTDATGKFRTTDWSPVIVSAAKVMYKRLRLGDPELPKWSKLSLDATDHYCVAAQNAIETFHYEASKNVETWVSY